MLDENPILLNFNNNDWYNSFTRTVIAPLLGKPNKLWTNFWGAVASDGFYARSRDYFQIVEMKRRYVTWLAHNWVLIILLSSGIWNVPFINVAILFKGEWLRSNKAFLPSYSSQEYEPDMTFCKWMRDNVIYSDHTLQWGYCIHHIGALHVCKQLAHIWTFD